MAESKISATIHIARPSDTDEKSRVFEPTGEYVQFKSSGTGYFEHAFELTQPVDDSNVQSGMGIGMLSIAIKDGGDQAAQSTIRALRQGRQEVILVYREFRQEAESGRSMWTNIRTLTAWCYISMARLNPGASSMSFEVHCMRDTTQDDVNGQMMLSLDLLAGDKAFGDQSLGKRQPKHLDPPGTPESEDWDELLNA